MFSKKKDEKNAVKPRTFTQLEQLCADDKETYEALVPVMFLDPRKVETTVKQAAENAKRFEKDKDFVSARMWYEVAGGLSLYEGTAGSKGALHRLSMYFLEQWGRNKALLLV